MGKRVWPKGRCPYCERIVVVWDGGFLRPHNGAKPYNDPRKKCPGSHQLARGVRS